MAECRYALTGVGATIAPGSQPWNGYWADLVKAPMAIEHQRGGDRSAGRRVGQDLAELVGARLLAQDHEAEEHGEPAGTGDEDRLQGGGPRRREPVRSPISRNDVTDVSSQKP